MDEDRYKLDDTGESTVGESARNESYTCDDNQRYSYSDYLQWDDDQRWELIDGVPFINVRTVTVASENKCQSNCVAFKVAYNSFQDQLYATAMRLFIYRIG